MRGEELLGLPPAQIARHGVGYVPQGRRLWRSLTVDEHLRMTAVSRARRLDRRARLRHLPPPGRAAKQRRRAAFRRRAADAGDFSRAGDQSASPDHGRADRGSCACDRRAGRGDVAASRRGNRHGDPRHRAEYRRGDDRFPKTSPSWSTGGSTASSSRAGSPPIANSSSAFWASAAIPTPPNRSAPSRLAGRIRASSPQARRRRQARRSGSMSRTRRRRRVGRNRSPNARIESAARIASAGPRKDRSRADTQRRGAARPGRPWSSSPARSTPRERSSASCAT